MGARTVLNSDLMSLWFPLMVNDRQIGTLFIGRLELLGNPQQPTEEVHLYGIYLDGEHLGDVRHRYGDGPWALVHTALGLALSGVHGPASPRSRAEPGSGSQ